LGWLRTRNPVSQPPFGCDAPETHAAAAPASRRIAAIAPTAATRTRPRLTRSSSTPWPRGFMLLPRSTRRRPTYAPPVRLLDVRPAGREEGEAAPFRPHRQSV